ncbi:MAG: hypothetical protein ACYC09_04260 [Bacteroidota bacterium]
MKTVATNPFASLSEHEFDRRVTAEQMSVMRIIQGALIAGVTLFAAVVIALFFQTPPSSGNDMSAVYQLSLANIVIVFSTIALSRFFAEKLFAASRASVPLPNEDLYARAITVMRTAMILRMAILESSAFFGLVVALIAVTEGVAHAEPLYLLNLCSSLPLIIAGVKTFPSAESLRNSFTRNFKRAG